MTKQVYIYEVGAKGEANCYTKRVYTDFGPTAAATITQNGKDKHFGGVLVKIKAGQPKAGEYPARRIFPT